MGVIRMTRDNKQYSNKNEGITCINGDLATVNGGKIVVWGKSHVELLGPGISGHHVNMAVSYASEGNVKISMVVTDNKAVVYRFRTHSALQHYWSRMYNISDLMKSAKYSDMLKYTVGAYNFYFKEK